MARQGTVVLAVAATLTLSGCSAAGVPKIMEASVKADDRELVLTVDSCNADLTAEADESPSRVIVTVTARNYTSDDCADRIVVHLEQPLGARELLDATGTPVPVEDTVAEDVSRDDP